MNTRKGYKMLVIALFFAFISLISRSIIYLVLSVAIATMILFLLGNDKKMRKNRGSKVDQEVLSKKNKGYLIFLIIIAIIGGVLLGYGSLFFMEETIFHQYLLLPKQAYAAALMIVLGFLAVLTSLFFILRAELGIVSSKKQSKEIGTNIYCGYCGMENSGDHTFCCGCGQKLT